MWQDDTIPNPSMLAAADLTAADLTVVVTTSAVRSNPSTAMLASTLESLNLVPLLRAAPKLLVCDGCCVVDKPQHKAGRVTAEEKLRYYELVRRVREAAESADPGPFSGLSVLELQTRVGFGFAVRRALAEVRTRFVMVVQHDQQIVRQFDLVGVLRAMLTHPDTVKYVGLCSESTQHYAKVVRCRYGMSLERTRAYGGMPLLPLIFWFDKPHVAFTQHYRDVVFGSLNPFRRRELRVERLGDGKQPGDDGLQHGDGKQPGDDGLQPGDGERIGDGKSEETPDGATAMKVREAADEVDASQVEPTSSLVEADVDGVAIEALQVEPTHIEAVGTSVRQGGDRRSGDTRASTPASAPGGIVRLGNFIEDTFGRAQLADIVAHGLAAHAKYGTWQLDVGVGEGEQGVAQIHVMHVHGRRFWTQEQRAACGWPETQTETIQKRLAVQM